MAYSFGGGVRPELGRTDYSGYLQGALTGAQGVAAGGSAIGQGIASLGEDIAGGIKQYQQNKIVLGEQLGSIEGILSTDPSVVNEAPPEAQNLLKKLSDSGTLPMGDAAKLNGFLSATQATKQRMAAEKNAEITGALKRQQLSTSQANEASIRAALDASDRNKSNVDAFSSAWKGTAPAGGGERTPEAVKDAYVEEGGDPSAFKTLMDGVGQTGFVPKSTKLELSNGNSVDLVQVNNGQWQVIPGEKNKAVAGILITENNLKQIEEMAKLWASGDKAGARKVLIASGLYDPQKTFSASLDDFIQQFVGDDAATLEAPEVDLSNPIKSKYSVKVVGD